MEFANDITMVPFGRTDVLIGANDAPSPELSYRHGLNSACVHGISKIGIFLTIAANWERNVEKKKVGFGHTEIAIPPF